MTSEATPIPPSDTRDRIVDLALERSGMPARTAGESVADYVARTDFGPNTRFNLERVVEHAGHFDQASATSSAQSALAHHNDPNPPDAHPRKK